MFYVMTSDPASERCQSFICYQQCKGIDGNFPEKSLQCQYCYYSVYQK